MCTEMRIGEPCSSGAGSEPIPACSSGAASRGATTTSPSSSSTSALDYKQLNERDWPAKRVTENYIQGIVDIKLGLKAKVRDGERALFRIRAYLRHARRGGGGARRGYSPTARTIWVGLGVRNGSGADPVLVAIDLIVGRERLNETMYCHAPENPGRLG